MPLNKRLTSLSVSNHDRDAAAFRYVYPVVSRRAGGVSVGVNLNPNNACNFRCVYCQVPGLVAGKGPEIDVELLQTELRQLLTEVLHGDFLQARVPEGLRRLNDIALSGNGEPTSSPQFRQVITAIRVAREALAVSPEVKTVLITNGTLCDKPGVQPALADLSNINGEIWFKLDSATPEGMRRINSTKQTPQAQRRRLEVAARTCSTWLQTCLFQWAGLPPERSERAAYLRLVRDLVDEGVPVRGVHLYGIARQSHQPEAAELSALPRATLEEFAAEIRAVGLPVRVAV